MLKEPIEVRFFAIQADLLLWHQFHWRKIWQRPLKITETVPRKLGLKKLYYMT